MVNRLADLFPIIFLAGLASVAFAPVLIRLAPMAGLLDEPGSAPHKSHPVPTPLVGGPSIALAIATAYLILRPSWTFEIMIISLGGVMVLVWGLLDDLIGLRPQYKLLGQLVVAAVLLAGGIQVRFAGAAWINGLITLVWYVGLMNAFNFVDSMDGLALGLAAIGSAFFMMVTIDSGQPALALFSAALVGACIGAYLYNAAPARLFLGDSGAQLVGCLLAAIGVAYVPGGAGLPQGVSWFTPILVLGLPIFDTTLVVVSRLRRGAPIYQPSRDHTFHRLLMRGLDPTRSVLAMQLTAIMLGLVAFIALDASVLLANLLFGLILIVGGVLLIVLVRQPPPGAV
ncbi:MAG: MraY family glycosyltransferase [Anaerolineales bacterium]